MLSVYPNVKPPTPNQREARASQSPGPAPPPYRYSAETGATPFGTLVGAAIGEPNSLNAQTQNGRSSPSEPPPMFTRLKYEVKMEKSPQPADANDEDGKNAGASTSQPPPQPPAAAKRRSNILYCSKCQAHGEVAPLKGHKKVCPFRNCGCIRCNAVDLDRFCNLTSHRICKLRRREGDQPVEKRKYFTRPESQALIGTEILTNNETDEEGVGSGQGDVPKSEEGPAGAGPSTSSAADPTGLSGLPFSLAALRSSKVEKYCRKCLEHGVTLKIYRKEHDRQCWFRTCECPKCVIINEWRRIQTDRKKIANHKRREQRMRQKQLLKAQAGGADGAAASASSSAAATARVGSRALASDSASEGDASRSAVNEELDNSSVVDESGDGDSIHVTDNERLLESPPAVGVPMSPPTGSSESSAGPPLPGLHLLQRSSSLAPRSVSQTELVSSQPLPPAAAPAGAALPGINPAAALLCSPYYQMVVQCLSQMITQALLQQAATPAMSGTGINLGISSMLQQLQAEQLAAILKLSGGGQDGAALNLQQLAQLQEQSQSLLPPQLLAQFQAQALGANALMGSQAIPLQLQIPALAALSQLQTQAVGALPLPFAAAALPPAAIPTSGTNTGSGPGAGLVNQTEIANLLLALSSGQPQQQSQPPRNSPPAAASRHAGAGTVATNGNSDASSYAYSDRIDSGSRLQSAGALNARNSGLNASSDALAIGAGASVGIGKRTRTLDPLSATSRARGSSRKRASAGNGRDLLHPPPLPPPLLVPLPRASGTQLEDSGSVDVDES